MCSVLLRLLSLALFCASFSLPTMTTIAIISQNWASCNSMITLCKKIEIVPSTGRRKTNVNLVQRLFHFFSLWAPLPPCSRTHLAKSRLIDQAASGIPDEHNPGGSPLLTTHTKREKIQKRNNAKWEKIQNEKKYKKQNKNTQRKQYKMRRKNKTKTNTKEKKEKYKNTKKERKYKN